MLRGARRLGMGLFKDTQNLALKLREFNGEHNAARVQDEIEARWQKIDVAAKNLAHAALDAVALMGLSQHFARGEANTRPGLALCDELGRLRSQEPAH
jgi:hypothetical protein